MPASFSDVQLRLLTNIVLLLVVIMTRSDHFLVLLLFIHRSKVLVGRGETQYHTFASDISGGHVIMMTSWLWL